MNDGFDPLFAVRTYTDPKSQVARDRWITFRESQGMPVVTHTDRFSDVPGQFAKQWAAMRAAQP